ncbi:MAG: FG-GAP-like repeat-containing protein [Chloroflexi bacterium]|nr:FG-GAP-like repeat-containing protein [Chloroflexota bacterium]
MKHLIRNLFLGFLSLLLFQLTTSAFAFSPAAPTPPVVTLNGQAIQQSSPAAADFDGDGDKEIVIGGSDGMLYVIAHNNGTWNVVWSRQTASDMNAAGAPSGAPCVTSLNDIRSAPAVGDLDGDGKLEIVVSTGGDLVNHRNGGVLVYRYQFASPAWTFSLVPGWPQPKIDQVGSGDGAGSPDGCWDGIWSTPALGDLDGDGKLEIVVEGFDRRIHAWRFNGQPVAGWPIYRNNGDRLLNGGWSSPALGDIDNDGLPEVVVGTDSPPWGGEGTAPDYSKATIWALNGDSTNVPGWPVAVSQKVQSSPALGDIDGDGRLEIVVGTGTGINNGATGYKVYAFRGNGTALPGWPKTTMGNMPASPALADLTGDGKPEVIIGCGAEGDPYPNPPCTLLYAWYSNGNSVAGFPMSPANNNPWPTSPNGLPYAPVVADYDGDGALEILILNRWSWGISTVEANGASSNDPTLQTANTLSSSPLVDDVDNDGKLEIIVGGANSSNSGGKGAVYIWEVNGSATGKRPWPAFRHGMYRAGLYAPPTAPTLTRHFFIPQVKHR